MLTSVVLTPKDKHDLGITCNLAVEHIQLTEDTKLNKLMIVTH